MGQGEVLLKRAKGTWRSMSTSNYISNERNQDLCNSLNELSEQEKTAEILPIAVQQLYILKKLGKTEDAEKIAEEIPVQE